MKTLKSILLIFGCGCASVAGAYRSVEENHWTIQPMQTRHCLVEGNFSCQQYEYTYSVKGISCTEDCLAFSRLNTCQLTNRCDWNAASGCFRKAVCIELSKMNTCRRWETEAVCD